MFTTLSVINAKEKRIKIKGARRFISNELQYKNYTFYTTNLFTKREENKKSINRFYKRADMPVVTKGCEILEKYKFITLANTVLSRRNIKSIGIIDETGKIPFLLPFLSQKCGIISIFTNNPDAYINKCEQTYFDFGTPTYITDKLGGVLNADMIFSASHIRKPFDKEIITPTDNTDIFLPHNLNLPEDCNPFLVCAGLYFYGGFKEFGKIKLKEG